MCCTQWFYLLKGVGIKPAGLVLNRPGLKSPYGLDEDDSVSE